ncbi:unnamed protein product [Urochloa humidicola]
MHNRNGLRTSTLSLAVHCALIFVLVNRGFFLTANPACRLHSRPQPLAHVPFPMTDAAYGGRRLRGTIFFSGKDEVAEREQRASMESIFFSGNDAELVGSGAASPPRVP